MMRKNFLCMKSVTGKRGQAAVVWWPRSRSDGVKWLAKQSTQHKDRDGSLPSRSHVLVFSASGNVEESNAPLQCRDVAGLCMAVLRGLPCAAQQERAYD